MLRRQPSSRASSRPSFCSAGELVERPPDAVHERGGRRRAQLPLVARVVERGGKRHRLLDVGDEPLGRGPRRLDGLHHVGQRGGAAVQVVDARAVERRPRGPDERAGHVLRVDQIGRAAPAQLEGPAQHGGLHGQRGRGRHADVAAGTVHRLRPEAGGADAVLFPVNAREGLVGHLVHAVVGGGVVRRVVAQRPRRIECGRAEHGRRRRVDDALDLAAAAPRHLEHVGGADDVDQGPAGGILPTQRHLPGRQVDDATHVVLAARRGPSPRDR